MEVADHSKVIAQGSETVTVDDYSTYSFGYTVPELIIAGQDSKVNVSLSTVDVGTLDYDAVRFYFAKIDGADDVIFKATDSKGVEHTFTNSGAWGPGAVSRCQRSIRRLPSGRSTSRKPETTPSSSS